MTEDFVIDALITIGNAKKVKEFCEPNIMESMELKSWMVKRTLRALELLEDEWKIYQDTERITE